MISLSCTNCKTMLSIDDAFAGGVCRCQHCGTIQTVPAHARGQENVSGGSFAGHSLGGSKIMARDPSRDKATPGTGLDELADIVASSGLAGSGLSSRRLSRPPSATATAVKAQAKKLPLPLLIGVGAAVALLLIAVVMVMKGGSDTTKTTSTSSTDSSTDSSIASNPQTGTTPPPQPIRGPSYCGVPIDGSVVIFVLDRGSGSRDVFDQMKSAAIKSIVSLGPERKFQVIFWSNGSDEALFPATGPTYATPKKVDDCQKYFDDIVALGATDVGPAVTKAYSQSPDAIVLASGKGTDLADDFLSAVEQARKGASIRTYTFSLGEGDSPALKKLADNTGAVYKHIAASELDAFTR